MLGDILKIDNIKLIEGSKGFSVCSHDLTKRYYFLNKTGTRQKSASITLILFNPGTSNGEDRTVNYIEDVREELGFESFDIINLIPVVSGNKDKLKNEDFKFDSLNFRIAKQIIENSLSPIWLGYGGLVKGNTAELLPIEYRKLLQKNSLRTVQIDRGKPKAWYPLHPSYAAGRGRGRIDPKDVKLVPFNTKLLNMYPL